MMNSNSSLERQLRTLRKRSTFTLFLTWLALFFTVVGIAAGYKNFLRVHDKAKVAQDTALSVATLTPSFASKDEVAVWKESVSHQLAQTNAQSAAELKTLKAVSESNAYITSALNKQLQQMTLQQGSPQGAMAPSQQWKANDARYLLQMASRKLVIDQDVAAAKQALVLADEALTDAAIPALLAVRAHIAKDIVALNHYQPVQLEAVVLAIGQLSTGLMPSEVVAATDDSTRQLLVVAESGDRQSIINRVKESINKAVVVRTYDEDLARKINGDTETVQYALLQLKLEGLKLLAFKQQQAAYDEQLAQIIEQLEATPHAADEMINANLDVLASFKLTQSAPAILSLEHLNVALREQQGAAQ